MIGSTKVQYGLEFNIRETQKKGKLYFVRFINMSWYNACTLNIMKILRHLYILLSRKDTPEDVKGVSTTMRRVKSHENTVVNPQHKYLTGTGQPLHRCRHCKQNMNKTLSWKKYLQWRKVVG